MSLIKRAFGVVYAEQDDHEIRLRGVRADNVARDIMKSWGTSRIEQNMFNKIRHQLLSFPHFFAVDVHYVLRTILNNKRMVTNKGVIRKALEELEQNTWLKDLTAEQPNILDHSKKALFHKTPLPHQENFFRIYNDRTQAYRLTGYLLSAAAGSGKTLIGLMLAEMLHAKLVVIVVPKPTVFKVWGSALEEEYKTPQDRWIAAEGKPYNGERFIIAHYEALPAAREAARKHGGKDSVVILDESHNLNEMASLRTQLFIQMCKELKCQHVLWSSGTPLKALGREVIPLLHTIDPLFTPEVEQRFLKIFGKESARGLDILRNRMGMISFRVEKGDVVDNKASTHQVKVKIPNGKDYTLSKIRDEMEKFVTARLKHYSDNMKQYEQIYREALELHGQSLKTSDEREAFKTYKQYISEIRDGYDPKLMAEEARYCNAYEAKQILPSLPQQKRADFKNAKSVIKYVQLKVFGEALGSVLGKKRAQCHVDMIPYMNMEKYVEMGPKKTVVFTSFVNMANEMEAYFIKKGYKPLVVHGTAASDLTSTVSKFAKDPEANPLIATYQSLSTGVPLVMANVAIFTNQPWRSHEQVQARARIDRLGQDTPVHFVDMYLDTGDEPNISTRSKDILEWSKAQVSAILGTDYTPDAADPSDNVAVGMEHLSLESYSEEQLLVLDEIMKQFLV